ncbi:MAG: DUF4410 domain-containing protein [Vicinamibacterales bacterium]
MITRSAILLACAVTVASSAQSPTRVIEDGRLDYIELFVEKLPSSTDIAAGIVPFTAEGANLGTGGPEGDEDEQKEAKQLQQECPGIVASAFARTLGTRGGFKTAQEGATGAGLIVGGHFTELNPGSRAKRYVVGFGAGKSAVAVEGDVKDAAGTLFAKFRQRRIAAMGMFGGDSVKKMREDCKNIGEDLAAFLSAWAKGQKLD